MSPSRRFAVLVLFIASLTPHAATAQQAPFPRLLFDAHEPGQILEEAFVTGQVQELGERVVFDTSRDGVWVSDGTVRGTRALAPGRLVGRAGSHVLVAADGLRVIDPASLRFRPLGDFVGVGETLASLDGPGLVIFEAAREGQGAEPWVSDGTPAGTRRLLPAGPAPWEGFLAGAATERRFFFVADERDATGRPLFVTDGTAAGTAVIRENASGEPLGGIGELNAAGDRAYFLTRIDGSQRLLYSSDGTAAGTWQLVDPVPNGQFFLELWAAVEQPEGDTWLVTEGQGSLDIWSTDGTLEGTSLVGTAPGTVYPATALDWVVHQGRLYFTSLSEEGTRGEVWEAGTTAGSLRRLREVAPEVPSDTFLAQGDPSSGDTLYFVGRDEAGLELWRTDRTAAGTGRVADLCPGPCNGGGAVYSISGVDVTVGLVSETGPRVPFALEGGSVRALESFPEGHNGFGTPALRGGDFALFTAFDRLVNTYYWTTDGTVGGTDPLFLIADDAVDRQLRRLTLVDGGGIAFVRQRRVRDDETVWFLDPSGDAAPLWSGDRQPQVVSMVSVGGRLVWVARENGVPRTLWVSDGTPQGTIEGDPIPLEVEGGGAGLLQTLGNRLFIGLRPVDLDTGALLPPLTDDGIPLYVDSAPDRPADLIAHRGRGYFFTGSVRSATLWRTDGTVAGTEALDGPFAFPRLPTALGRRLAFFSYDDSRKLQLQVLDPVTGEITTRPAVGLEEVRFPRAALGVGGRVYLAEEEGLWASDRALGSFTRLFDAEERDHQLQEVDQLRDLNGTLLFTAFDGTAGRELWRSDGTRASTRRVVDLAPGASSSDPGSLVTVDGRLYFDAWTPTTGRELWTSDGTASGTRLLIDQVVGAVSSRDRDIFGSSELVAGTDRLVFTAWTQAVHNALWSLPTVGTTLSPEPPAGPWLTSARVPGFRFKVRITDQQGGEVVGVQEPGCIEETLCVSGALPGRSEVFLRVVGPKPNGFLWPTLVKFTTSQVEVWVERGSGEGRYYLLPGATAGGADLLPALFDRQGFPASTGQGAGKAAGQPVRWHDGTSDRLEPGEPEIPAGSEGIVSAAVPGFRFHVRLTSQAGDELPTAEEAVCIDETVCVSGSVPGRSELFLRVIGPRPNGFLWPTIVRFTTSEVEVWVEQLATGETRYYRLPAASPGSESLDGLFDRQGFR